MIVGFLLRILEEDGSIVREVIADRNFNPVRAGLRSADFPMMGTLDPYGDTSFNYLQCELLEEEIKEAALHLMKCMCLVILSRSWPVFVRLYALIRKDVSCLLVTDFVVQ